MRTLTLLALLASFLTGLALIHGAPPRWRLDPWQGILLGTALYMGVVNRWLAWRRAAAAGAGDTGRLSTARAAWGLALRALLFLAIVAGEGYAYFEWIPPADLRGPFVMLSAWIVTETLLAPRGLPPRGLVEPVSGASPRA